MNTDTVLKPRISEKAYGMSSDKGGKTDRSNTYVFDVDRGQTKHTVARAVQAQYNVTVVSVNITNLKGKAKRTVRKGGRPVAGRTADVKKAYVTLKAGESLPIFAAIDEAAAKEEETAQKLTKAAAREAERSSKAAAKEAKQAAKDAKKEKK